MKVREWNGNESGRGCNVNNTYYQRIPSPFLPSHIHVNIRCWNNCVLWLKSQTMNGLRSYYRWSEFEGNVMIESGRRDSSQFHLMQFLVGPSTPSPVATEDATVLL